MHSKKKLKLKDRMEINADKSVTLYANFLTLYTIVSPNMDF